MWWFLGFGIFGFRNTIHNLLLRSLTNIENFWKRALALLVAIIGLSIVYLYQQFNFLGVITNNAHSYMEFVVNKSVRYLLNDSFCLLIIYAFFNRKIIRAIRYHTRNLWIVGFTAYLFCLKTIL